MASSVGKFIATVIGEFLLGVLLVGNVQAIPAEWRGLAFTVVSVALIAAGTASFVVWVWRDRPEARHKSETALYRGGAIKLVRRYFLEVHRNRKTGMPKGLSPEQIEHQPVPKFWADKIYDEIGLPREDEYR